MRVAGAVPVFAEVDESLNLDPADAAAKVTERTVAILPVHIENVACDLEGVLRVARDRGLAVLEDAAQSLGAGRSQIVARSGRQRRHERWQVRKLRDIGLAYKCAAHRKA